MIVLVARRRRRRRLSRSSCCSFCRTILNGTSILLCNRCFLCLSIHSIFFRLETFLHGILKTNLLHIDRLLPPSDPQFHCWLLVSFRLTIIILQLAVHFHWYVIRHCVLEWHQSPWLAAVGLALHVVQDDGRLQTPRCLQSLLSDETYSCADRIEWNSGKSSVTMMLAWSSWWQSSSQKADGALAKGKILRSSMVWSRGIKGHVSSEASLVFARHQHRSIFVVRAMSQNFPSTIAMMPQKIMQSRHP